MRLLPFLLNIGLILPVPLELGLFDIYASAYNRWKCQVVCFPLKGVFGV